MLKVQILVTVNNGNLGLYIILLLSSISWGIFQLSIFNCTSFTAGNWYDLKIVQLTLQHCLL